MLKYILTLFILYNGECYEDRVTFGADNKQFVLESSYYNIHAKKSNINIFTPDYIFYESGDTIYAVKMNLEYGFMIQMSSFVVENKRIRTLQSIMLRTTPCNQEDE